MQLKQNISQKQTQNLAMTQQLQQSIQILQYNSEELYHYLESKALENPLIEIEPVMDDSMPIQDGTFTKNPVSEESDYLNQIVDNDESLFENLTAQVYLNYRDTYLRQLILFLLEYIDVNGYLTISLEEAMELSQAEYLPMLDAITLLQQLDPAGIGARNLQECLMLQTERDDEAPEIAYLLLEEDFEDLVMRQWQNIAKKYQVELSDVQQVFDYIQTLTPSPGNIFGHIHDQYIIPELLVEKKENELSIHLIKSGTPRIIFQEQYFTRLGKNEDQEVLKYLQDKKAEFHWLQKTITQRGNTILNIGRFIIEKQKDFFYSNGHSLQPMTLKEVAHAIGVHESTVSRAINGKYMQTDFGVFELRSFFISGVTLKGVEAVVSNQEIKNCIEELIQKENKQKPLSDQKILEKLIEMGYPISRRTVAKYREDLGILSSSKRKRFDE